jgi:hypothetical protein
MDLRGQTERANLVGATETSRYRKYIYVSIWLSASDFDEYRWHRRSVVFVSCPISVLLLDEIFFMQSSDGAFSFYKKQLRQSAPHHTSTISNNLLNYYL